MLVAGAPCKLQLARVEGTLFAINGMGLTVHAVLVFLLHGPMRRADTGVNYQAHSPTQ